MDLRKLNEPRPVAATIGLAVVAVAALYSSLQFLRNSTDTPGESTDYVSSYERRVGPVKQLLPKRGVIGYISDDPVVTDYYLANYTLSPVLVDKGDSRQIVLVNLTRDAETPVDPDQVGEYTVRRKADSTVYDFGRGVLLVERDSK